MAAGFARCWSTHGAACLPWLLVFFCLNSPALAQYRFDSWNTANGLPENSIMALQQTRDGYLWLTTQAGLVRFDGVRFRVFNRANTPGLTSDQFSFFTLFEDRQGALWAGTLDGAVVRYYDGLFTVYTTREGLPGKSVMRIDEDAEGTIWIFTEGGLAKWNGGHLRVVAPEPGSSFNNVLATPANVGVDGGYFGLWRLDSSGWQRFAYGRWSRLPLPPHITDPAKLEIGSLVEDSQRRLWYSERNRPGEYYRVSDGHLTVFRGLPRDAFVCYQDRQGYLWLSDHEGGNALWKDGQLTPLVGLSTPFIFRALVDHEGTLWIGTKNEGLYHLRRPAITVYRHPGGQEFNDIRAILQDRAGNIWFGSSGGGLARFRDGRFENFYRSGRRWEFPNIVSALYEDRDGAIWLGSWHGLARFKHRRFLEEKHLSVQIHGIVRVIHRDRAGTLWFGSDHGLYCLRDGKLTHYGGAQGLTGEDVDAILEDRAGTLWIGTDGGLSHFANGGFSSFTEVEGLSSGRVTSLYEDEAGVLWIGTLDGGLNRLEKGKLTRYTTENGLYDNAVFQILEDDQGFFWIGCHLGLYRVRKQELNEFAAGRVPLIASTHFGKADGLVNAEGSSEGQPRGFRTRDGKLWFGTQKGIALADPKALLSNDNPPPVVIEECTVDRHSIDSRRGLMIHPTQANLEIHYTGLSFINSDQIRFKYKLEGLDRGWIEAGTRRTAYYSHVPPGQYVFRVIAANSDGVWNTKGKSLPLVVVPPFYRTWWFLALALVCAGAAAYLAWQVRVSQLKRAHATQQAFSRQLIASQEGERKRIAAELHDSLGQNLLIIKNRALLGSMVAEAEPATQEQFRKIADSASTSIEEVRQIAYNLRPYHLDRLGLTQALEAMIEKVAASTSIHFTQELVSIDGLFPKEAEITIFRIVQESINNVVKHSQASEARVTIERESQVVTITIQDNGRGFAPPTPDAARNGGFGLVGLSQRVRILGGEETIRSAPGRGTTIRITLDVASAASARP